jgi:deazaflavin-dependent oxidoreductase (nitroreductase family)
LLGRGVAVGSQHLLSVVGRSSGIVRRTPVSIVRVDDDRYIVAAFPTANWVLNARAKGEGSLSRRRRDERVRLIELSVEAREPILRAFFEQVPGGVRFFGGRGPDAVVRSADRYPVFRVVTARAAEEAGATS